jgi:hypothetical protein
VHATWLDFLGVSNFHWKLTWRFIQGTIILIIHEFGTGWSEIFSVDECILQWIISLLLT